MTVGKIFEKYCLCFCFPLRHGCYYFYLLSNLDCGVILEFQVSNGNHSGTLVLGTKCTILELGLPRGSFSSSAQTSRTGPAIERWWIRGTCEIFCCLNLLRRTFNTFSGVLPAAGSACPGQEGQAEEEDSLFIPVLAKIPDIGVRPPGFTWPDDAME